MKWFLLTLFYDIFVKCSINVVVTWARTKNKNEKKERKKQTKNFELAFDRSSLLSHGFYTIVDARDYCSFYYFIGFLVRC